MNTRIHSGGDATLSWASYLYLLTALGARMVWRALTTRLVARLVAATAVVSLLASVPVAAVRPACDAAVLVVCAAMGCDIIAAGMIAWRRRRRNRRQRRRP